MKLRRRKFLRLVASAAALPVVARSARAQAYPMRPVRIIVGFVAGGTQDILARLVAQRLSERLGQSFLVENRPGGGGNIAVDAVVRAPADGHTLLLVGPPNAINATLYPNLHYNFIRDIAPVAAISREPNVMVVNPSIPATTVAEFIAYARANAGTINMGSSGSGSGPHLCGELFKMMTGLDMTHVPYRGGNPAMTDLLGGQLHVMFASMPAALGYIRAGQLRALAVTTAKRSHALPDVPVMGDFVPGYEASSVYGLGAPKNTPADIIDRLNREITAAFADPAMEKRLAVLGGIPLPGSPADFGKLMADETEKWGRVVKFARIKVE